MKDLRHYSLLPHNTFGMDVRAARFVEYVSVAELISFLRDHKDMPLLHIGGGSNLLFTKDYEGIVLHSALKDRYIVKETEDEVLVCVGAGVVWDDFVAYTVSNGWYGAENLSYIPGEVGASAVQNIGAYGVEVKDLIAEVDTVAVEDGSIRHFSNEECRYSYRQSVFKKELKGKYIVTHVTYRLSKKPLFRLEYGNIRAELERTGCELTLENLRELIVRIRKEKLPDPKTTGNAGSFFMNPVIPVQQFEALKQQYPDMPSYPAPQGLVKVPAGWMIERCGWKGKTMGNAGVHGKQALVLVNCGGATGEEIIRLSQAVVRSVQDKFGIAIHPEVNFI